ncbi:MAG: 50S ribosomal protein L30 [Acidobacteriales bacterium]|nr:50S ribosomal protein L30 [Terriglobales bacterium]
MPKALAKMKSKNDGSLQLRWVRSAICAPVKQKLVIKGLGFTRLNQVIERPDTAAIRGMVAKVPHLVEIIGPSTSK